MAKPYTDLDIKNILFVFRISPEQEFENIGNRYSEQVERFLHLVYLSRKTLLQISKEENLNTLNKVFAQGFLSPTGEFHWLDIAQHEWMVGRCTGFSDVDEACFAGWVKFSFGLPYNHLGENLLSKKCDRSKVTKKQLDWMRQHYKDLMEDDVAVNDLFARFEI
jgi:hypothetical protein